MRVLAIGATGQYAGLVVPALAARSVQVRALVHDPAKQDQVVAAGADEAVTGDLRDPASLRAALDGVQGSCGPSLAVRRVRWTTSSPSSPADRRPQITGEAAGGAPSGLGEGQSRC